MKLKIIFSSLLIVSVLLTSTFTSVISSSSITLDIKQPIKTNESTYKVDILKIEDNPFITGKNRKDGKEDSLSKFNTVINLIKLVFRDNSYIVNICQRANVLLQILPDSICHLIYWFVVSPISMILLNIWNNHPDYLIQYYAYYLYELLLEIYFYFCDWSPTMLLNLWSTDAFSNNNICPCALTK